jgi:hypothetical protein
MDSITNPKVKTVEEGVAAHPLVRSTSAVKGRVGAPGWDYEDWQANQLLTQICINQTTSWLMRNCNTLVHGRTTGKHRLIILTTTWTWGKPPPSPLHYSLCLAMGPTPKCHFVPGLPSGSPEIPKIGTLATLDAHNFVWKPSIEVRSKTKLKPLSSVFQWYVTWCLNARKLGWFLTFSGRKSNCKFDSRPFFWP